MTGKRYGRWLPWPKFLSLGLEKKYEKSQW